MSYSPNTITATPNPFQRPCDPPATDYIHILHCLVHLTFVMLKKFKRIPSIEILVSGVIHFPTCFHQCSWQTGCNARLYMT